MPAVRASLGALGSALALSGCAYVARQLTVAYLKVDALTSPKEIAIELDRSFIERYRNRVTIDAPFIVDLATVEPNGAEFDGDMHVVGRSAVIGLPIVMEIANAAHAPAAMDLIHHEAGNGKALRVMGVWRIWPEHAGGEVERQGEPVKPIDRTYPSHVFEIHPVIRIEDQDLSATFRPVKGYRPGSAESTLEIYEKATATLTVGPKTVQLVTQTNLFNDLHFVMEISADPQLAVADGRFVTASALSLKGDLLVRNLRMVFARGTPPELVVRNRRRGDRLHVWGMPRINYAEVARRAARAAVDPSGLSGRLPYEIIVIGVYDE